MIKSVYSAGFRRSMSAASVAVLLLAATQALAEDEHQELVSYTLDEVREHDSRNSCWLVIADRVYDVTRFIPEHPTPPGILLLWCGKEATEAWRTKGYGNSHSAEAHAKLAEHLIGVLEEE